MTATPAARCLAGLGLILAGVVLGLALGGAAVALPYAVKALTGADPDARLGDAALVLTVLVAEGIDLAGILRCRAQARAMRAGRWALAGAVLVKCAGVALAVACVGVSLATGGGHPAVVGLFVGQIACFFLGRVGFLWFLRQLAAHLGDPPARRRATVVLGLQAGQVAALAAMAVTFAYGLTSDAEDKRFIAGLLFAVAGSAGVAAGLLAAEFVMYVLLVRRLRGDLGRRVEAEGAHA